MFGYSIVGRRSAAFVLAAAFQAFWGWRALTNGEWLLDDSITYLEIARNLPNEYARFPGVADVQRPPGYPFFLFVLYFLLGTGATGTIIAQKISVFVTALGIYKTATLFSPRNYARKSALLYLFLPYPALFSSLLLTETLFVALLVWAAYGALKSRYVVSGLLLAVGTWVKPLAMVAAAFLFAAAAVQELRRGKFSMNTIFIVFLPAAAVWVWQCRNAVVAQTPSFSTSGNTAKLYGIGAAIDALADKADWSEESLIYYGEKRRGETRFVAGFPAQETAVFHAPFPWGTMFERPEETLKFYALSLWGMARGTGWATAEKISHSRVAAVVVAVWGAIVIFALWMAAFWPQRRFESATMLVVAVGLVLAHASAWADGRYRMPSDVFILIAATPTLWNRKRF